MSVGEKIKQARLAAGLSQRQLCGDQVTRNMLSLIENGSARPSMDTLAYFAQQLGKPISYFLDETAVVSPNADCMCAARSAYRQKDCTGVLAALADYAEPDPVFDDEKALLSALCYMSLARDAFAQQRQPYARQLLGAVDVSSPYFTAALQREYQLLMGLLPPADDRELLLRAEFALQEENFTRALDYLAATELQESTNRNLLCGKAYLGLKDYANAIAHLQKAENADPKTCLTALEICYRETGDFENAYRCACKLRDL